MGPLEAGVRKSLKNLYYIERCFEDVEFGDLSAPAHSYLEAAKVLLHTAIAEQKELAVEFENENK